MWPLSAKPRAVWSSDATSEPRTAHPGVAGCRFRPHCAATSNGAGVPIPPSWRRWDGGWCSQLTVTPHSETTTNSYDRRRSDSSSRRSFGRSVSGRARAHRPSDSHDDSPLLGARCVPT